MKPLENGSPYGSRLVLCSRNFQIGGNFRIGGNKILEILDFVLHAQILEILDFVLHARVFVIS